MKYPALLGVLVLLAALANTGCKKPAEVTDATVKQRETRVERDRTKQSQWYLTNLIHAYWKVGAHDPKWDRSATNAIRLIASARAGQQQTPDWRESVLSESRIAIQEGCTDPFIQYASIRYSFVELTAADEETAKALIPAVRAIRNSEYPSDVKFWACLAGAVALKKHSSNSVDVLDLRDGAAWQLVQALADPGLPPVEAYVATYRLLEAAKLNDQQPAEFWRRLEKPLFDHFDHTAYPFVLKGKVHYERAWKARGTGFADKVTKDGWKTFEKELTEAEKAFLKAWDLDPGFPDTANWMIKMSNCTGKPKAEMEKWFQRAMKSKPDFYDACTSKMWYLQPRWNGSVEEMLAFGRECVQNTNYTGNIPMILLDAYSTLAQQTKPESARAELYKDPTVWQDVRDAVTEMERRQPGKTWYYNNLAWYAWKCERWKELDEVMGKLDRPDYEYFGGRDQVDRMMQDLRAHTTR